MTASSRPNLDLLGANELELGVPVQNYPRGTKDKVLPISDLGAQFIALNSISYLEFRVKFFHLLYHFSHLKDQLRSLGEAQTVGYPTARLTQRQLFQQCQTETGQLSSARPQQISKAACSLVFWMDG